MRNLLENVLSEPRISNPPRRVWRDWVILAATTAGPVLEAVLRTDVLTTYVAVPLVMMLGVVLLWRRTHPFAVVAATFGSIGVFDLGSMFLNYERLDLYSAVLLLAPLYSVCRWGSGRDMLRGAPFVIGLTVLAHVLDYTGLGDVIGGTVVLALVVTVALVIRYRTRSREQERENLTQRKEQADEQIRVSERERLARELHDTVAHHVSAIAIQAQAGRFVAQNGSLDGATDALEVIEEEASRTLSEMRMIVGALRDNESPVEMVPQHGMSDIEALASTNGLPTVTVALADDVMGVGSGLGAAAYRIAQESITNARRHARNASTVRVEASGDRSAVHLTITDDGDPTTASATQGFGLIGMTERATLLGGTLTAGPAADRGWVVRATLPRENAP